MEFSVSAVIVAAGKGKRIGGIDKSFIKLRGKPIIKYSFDCLSQHKFVKEVVVVMNKENIEKGKMFLKSAKLRIMLGGDTRAESAKKGVLQSKEAFVLIHDAVRPFITEKLLGRVFSEMNSGVDAVITGIPIKSTIKEVDSRFFVKRTIEREKLINVQTPQLFRRSALVDAYKKYNLEGITDEAMLIEIAGGKIKVVKGLEENIKITTPFDLILMEGVMQKWSKE